MNQRRTTDRIVRGIACTDAIADCDPNEGLQKKAAGHIPGEQQAGKAVTGMALKARVTAHHNSRTEKLGKMGNKEQPGSDNRPADRRASLHKAAMSVTAGAHLPTFRVVERLRNCRIARAPGHVGSGRSANPGHCHNAASNCDNTTKHRRPYKLRQEMYPARLPVQLQKSAVTQPCCPILLRFRPVFAVRSARNVLPSRQP